MVNYENVTLEGDQIRFAKDGMGLDFGAIAKGYIADQIKRVFRSLKGLKVPSLTLAVTHSASAKNPDGSPFHIGIQKPFAERSETIAALEINANPSFLLVSTNAILKNDGNFYSSYFKIQRPVYPYDNSLISVTIISANP